MKIIEVNENSLLIDGITEMIINKEVWLYKSMEDYGMYKIKNTDVYICLVYKDSKLLNYGKVEVDYNTTVLNQLYKVDKLNAEKIIQLCKWNVFI